jgi:hypothetical protein
LYRYYLLVHVPISLRRAWLAEETPLYKQGTTRYPRLREPFYSRVERVIAYENKPKRQDLLKVVRESGLTVEEEIIKFCTEPRSKKEIATLLGISYKCNQWLNERYIKPLLDSGKLKMTLPISPMSFKQRFVSDGRLTPSEDEIIRFCETPRMRAEIGERFGLSDWEQWAQLTALVKCGKLFLTIPNCPQSEFQKFATVPSDIPELTDETLIEFCTEPKSNAEISTHFGISHFVTMPKLNRLITAGKLRVNKPYGERNRNGWKYSKA